MWALNPIKALGKSNVALFASLGFVLLSFMLSIHAADGSSITPTQLPLHLSPDLLGGDSELVTQLWKEADTCLLNAEHVAYLLLAVVILPVAAFAMWKWLLRCRPSQRKNAGCPEMAEPRWRVHQGWQVWRPTFHSQPAPSPYLSDAGAFKIITGADTSGPEINTADLGVGTRPDSPLRTLLASECSSRQKSSSYPSQTTSCSRASSSSSHSSVASVAEEIAGLAAHFNFLGMGGHFQPGVPQGHTETDMTSDSGSEHGDADAAEELSLLETELDHFMATMTSPRVFAVTDALPTNTHPSVDDLITEVEPFLAAREPRASVLLNLDSRNSVDMQAIDAIQTDGPAEADFSLFPSDTTHLDPSDLGAELAGARSPSTGSWSLETALDTFEHSAESALMGAEQMHERLFESGRSGEPLTALDGWDMLTGVGGIADDLSDDTPCVLGEDQELWQLGEVTDASE